MKYATMGNEYDPAIQLPHGSMENPNAEQLPPYRAAFGATIPEEEARVPFPKRIARRLGYAGYGDVAYNEYKDVEHKHVDSYSPDIIKKANEKEKQVTKDRLLEFYATFLAPAEVQDFSFANGTTKNVTEIRKTKSKMDMYKKRWLHITTEEKEHESAEEEEKKEKEDAELAELLRMRNSLESVIAERHVAYRKLFNDTLFAVEAVRWILHSYELSPAFFKSLDHQLKVLYQPYIDHDAEIELTADDDDENADLKDKMIPEKDKYIMKFFDNPQFTSYLLNRTVEEHPLKNVPLPTLTTRNTQKQITLDEEEEASKIPKGDRKRRILDGFYRHEFVLSSTETTFKDVIEESKKKAVEEKIDRSIDSAYRVFFDDDTSTVEILPEDKTTPSSEDNTTPKPILNGIQTFWKYYHILLSNEKFRYSLWDQLGRKIEIELIHAESEIRRLVFEEERDRVYAKAPVTE